jgi:hypothetical protein
VNCDEEEEEEEIEREREKERERKRERERRRRSAKRGGCYVTESVARCGVVRLGCLSQSSSNFVVVADRQVDAGSEGHAK